jgi:hypothetical protein
MSLNTKFKNLIPRLINEASNSNIGMKLAAVIIKGKNPISNIYINTQKNTCCGKNCGSLHAEANAIINYYGEDVLHPKNKQCRHCKKE